MGRVKKKIILSRKIRSVVGNKMRFWKESDMFCVNNKMIFGLWKTGSVIGNKIKKTFEGGFTFMRQVYYAYIT